MTTAAAEFKTICLTGGPCGGKSSCMSILSDVFENLGWRVYRVPETATILLNGGVVFADLGAEQSYSFQKSILRTMLTIEETYRDLARLNAAQGLRSVIICDRGALDPAAYMPRADWLRMLHEMGLEETTLRDSRYDVVVHLTTAAQGAEAHYTTANNNIRSEGIALARDLDERAMRAWTGHAYMDIIGNETDFAAKCNRVIETVLGRVGLSDKRYGKNIRKLKFVVCSGDAFADMANAPGELSYVDFGVEHIFLKSADGVETRIRRREQLASGTVGQARVAADDAASDAARAERSVHYSLTTRYRTADGDITEKRRILSGREYEDLRLLRDPTRAPILKTRRTFVWNQRYFQLDKFRSDTVAGPQGGLHLLEAYLDHPTTDYRDFAPSPASDESERQRGTPVSAEDSSRWVYSLLPPWFNLREVTGQREYSLLELSRVG